MAGVSVDPDELRWHASRLLAMADALAGQTVEFADRACDAADAEATLDQLQAALRQLAEDLVASAEASLA